MLHKVSIGFGTIHDQERMTVTQEAETMICMVAQDCLEKKKILYFFNKKIKYQ